VENVLAAAPATTLLDEEAVEAGAPAAGVGFKVGSTLDTHKSPRIVEIPATRMKLFYSSEDVVFHRRASSVLSNDSRWDGYHPSTQLPPIHQSMSRKHVVASGARCGTDHLV
jgi:hypothetical protein